MVPPVLLWRLEQEDQRMKKHDGRWIDIQWLRLLTYIISKKIWHMCQLNRPTSQTIPYFLIIYSSLELPMQFVAVLFLLAKARVKNLN